MSKYDDLEALLKKVGSELSDNFDVYPIPNQLNIRMLRIDKVGQYHSWSFGVEVPFDVNEGATYDSVRERIKATCDDRIEWFSELKEEVS